MHPRQSAKIKALQELGAGSTGYKTFSAAASFGHIHPDDFVQLPGYRPCLRWATSHTNEPDAAAKDHRLSRKWAYDNHAGVKNYLTTELTLALMRYAVRYKIPPESMFGGTLVLMAIICGHYKNAEIMSVRENSRKGAACSITLGQLTAAIRLSQPPNPTGG